ncbi:hypothetical protein D3C72_490010 [compost metagenome]
MRNADLIENFLNGHDEGSGSNLRIDGNKLVNYETVIAQRVSGGVVINTTYYSQTTARHQSKLKREAHNPIFVDGIRRGAFDLSYAAFATAN